MTLDELKRQVTECCNRLAAYRGMIQELRSKGDLEGIETAVSNLRSLAQHLEILRTRTLQPIVIDAENERKKQLPARIAQLENRLGELRANARKYIDQRATEFLTAMMVCGCKISPGGKGLIFDDSLSGFLGNGQSAYGRSEARRLEDEITQLRYRADHVPNYDYEFEKVTNECFQKAAAESGFDAAQDFFSPLRDK